MTAACWNLLRKMLEPDDGNASTMVVVSWSQHGRELATGVVVEAANERHDLLQSGGSRNLRPSWNRVFFLLHVRTHFFFLEP